MTSPAAPQNVIFIGLMMSHTYMPLRRLPAIFVFLLIPRLAWGHAVLLESTPAQGQVVPPGAIAVSLRFNSRVDARRSRLSLVPGSGGEQPLPLLPQSAADKVEAKIANAKPGRYLIRWQVLASDGHITRGQFAFQVDGIK